MTATSSAEARVLVLAPTGRDALLAVGVLQRFGIAAEPLTDAARLRPELDAGASALIVAEEAVTPAVMRRLDDVRRDQPPWSDLPVLVFTSANAEDDQRLDQLRQALGNVTFLERPLRTVTLVTAVRSALRARRRQYDLRLLLKRGAEELQARDNFLAMLGHELRNPLASIMMATELMDRAQVDTFARQRALIGRQTKHLSRLVDDLLDVARITTGKIVLRREPTDLAEIVRRGLLAADEAIRRQELQVTLDVPSSAVAVDGDPVRIEQVFSNLLTNALKYTPAQGRIHIGLMQEGNQAVLKMRDTGVGISKEMLAQVFELFSQADRTLARSQGGLGIGLNVTQRLVELHGGSVVVHSEGVGHGSEFLVRLPLVESPERLLSDPVSRPDERTRKVVLVEDQADFREAFLLALEQLGHQVEAAADGPAGLDLILRAHPEVAFVDIGLPGLDGYEVARRVRTAGTTTTLLVAVTGYGQPEDRRRAFEAGFDLHLTKPVDMTVVRDVLKARTDMRQTGSGAELH